MRLWREQMSQAGRTAQTPPSCALGKVLAEDRNWHAGPQRACGILRAPAEPISQPWPPGQLSLRWEAGKATEKPVPNSINSKKEERERDRNRCLKEAKGGKEVGITEHRAHTPGVELNFPHPQCTLERLERAELAAPAT